MMTHYEILEVPQTATSTEIKRAYYSAVKKYTPEHDPEKFEQVKTAYEVLQDPQQRLYYDSQLKMNWAEHFRYETGRMFAANGKTGKAVKEYEKLVKSQPDNVLFMRELAYAYEDRGFFHKAIAQYEKVLERNETDMDIWLFYLNCLLEHRFYEKTEKAIKKAVALNEQHHLKNVDILVYAIMHFICIADDDAFLRKCFDMLHKLDLTTASFPDTADMIIHAVLMTKAIDFVDDALLIGQNIKPQDYGYEQIEKLLLIKEFDTLYNSKAFDDAFTDLFLILLEDERSPEEKMDLLSLEGYLLFENPGLMRKQVRKISKEYPRLFALHKTFFLNFLNEKKEESMCRTYATKISAMLKKHPEFMEEDLSEEELESLKSLGNFEGSEGFDGFGDFADFADFKPMTPVRVEPKTGRNEPCPCGSGKKYKKCCGK